MKDNFIHVCFVVDSSSSMIDASSDVVGGFKKIVDEQKANDIGQCSVSLFTFGTNVNEIYLGKDVNDVEYLDYNPDGMTAMNDGIGFAIDKVGEWLNEMKEEERPSKNLVVIITDGEENYSRRYTLSQVQEMIKHQTEKYNWEFMYIGADVTSKTTADNLGIGLRSFTTKSDHYKNYSVLSNSMSAYRMSDVSCRDDVLSASLSEESIKLTDEFISKTGARVGNSSYLTEGD